MYIYSFVTTQLAKWYVICQPTGRSFYSVFIRRSTQLRFHPGPAPSLKFWDLQSSGFRKCLGGQFWNCSSPCANWAVRQWDDPLANRPTCSSRLFLASEPIFGWVIKASLSCRGILFSERVPGRMCFEIEIRRFGWEILLYLREAYILLTR